MMAGESRVAFITGVGSLDYWCGVSESVYLIARRLSPPPVTITTGPFGLARRLRAEGMEVEVNPFPITRLIKLRGSGVVNQAEVAALAAGYMARLYSILSRRRTRCVYVTDSAPLFFAPPVSRLAGARVVLGVRGEQLVMGRGGGVGRQWRLSFALSDRVAALSEEMREKILAAVEGRTRAGLSTKMRVIYNGVDLAAARALAGTGAEVRAELGLSGRDRIALYVGAFRRGKAQLEFIRRAVPACLAAAAAPDRVHFVFLGAATGEQDRDYERECREAAGASPRRGQLHFAGFHSNVWPWYAAADLVALASDSEGMPRALIEGMALARAAVSYDVCSARELLEPSGAGVVVGQGQAEELGRAIARLMDDDGLRREMGERGLAFARERLEIGAVARQYERMFDELCV